MSIKTIEAMNRQNPGAFRDSQGRALPQDFRQRLSEGKPLLGGSSSKPASRSGKVKPRQVKKLRRDAE